MKVLGLILAAIAYVEASTRGSYDTATLAQFASFVQTHNKQYASVEEEQHALDNFADNLVRLALENNPAHGVTKFSDMSPEEFKARYLTLQPLSEEEKAAMPEWDGTCTACERFPHHANLANTAAATNFDWTTLGAVNGVKDQAQCGSCWAFGTIADIEGTHFLAGYPLTSLSEQQLVSCDTKYGDQGCNGGLQQNAMKYILATGGVVLESAYPYTSGKGVTGKCDASKVKNFAATISSYSMISTKASTENNIYTALPQVGPITVAIDATPMQSYRSGIDNPSRCGAINHAVTIVGYGTENGVDYWKIKNSWGKSWGENGYYRIVRGKNLCGIATNAVHSVHTPKPKVGTSITALKSFRNAYDSVTLAQFDSFAMTYEKLYSTFEAEAHALQNFAENLVRLALENNSAHGITKFSDMSPEEFRAQYLTLQPMTEEELSSMPEWDGTCTACERFPHHANLANTAAATNFDWTTLGAVNGVKDQAQCGSCWAFGTIADIEGTHFLAGNPLISLSEQQLVSCDTKYGDQGCNGGLQQNAMKYILATGGVVLESAYPYTSGKGVTGKCDASKVKNFAATISSYSMISTKASTENNIYTALPQVGPITVAIDATPMQSYRSGIDNPSRCGAINHAVTIVGYGTENGVDYWKVKNSWGKNWGEKGYYRIVRGKNLCGIATNAVHSVHTKKKALH